MDTASIEKFEDILGYHFSDSALIEKSLSHSSQSDDRLSSNERLEFLGDSVLGLVVCEELYRKFPDCLEGDLTKVKSAIVSRKACSKVANSIGLTEFIKVGKGLDTSRALAGSIASGAIEGVIGAVYIDGGFEPAKKVILKMFGEMLDAADANQHHDNFKSVLQQYAQQKFSTTPTYELLDEKGPDHSKCFEVGVVIGRMRFTSAWGATKKQAEQKAAQNALVDSGVLKDQDCL